MGLGAVFVDSLTLEVFLDGRLRKDGEVVNKLAQGFENRFGPAMVIYTREDFAFLCELLGPELFFSYLRSRMAVPDTYFDFLAEELNLSKKKEEAICFR